MKKVMIAEDDLLMADRLEEILIRNDYAVCGIARTVEEGIELANRHRPALAILDLRLAKQGLATEIAGRLEGHGRPGILYATGTADHVSLTKDDGEACLCKPYDVTDVVRALKIVEQIIATGEAPQPFPDRFRVLLPTPRSIRPDPSDSAFLARVRSARSEADLDQMRAEAIRVGVVGLDGLLHANPMIASMLNVILEESNRPSSVECLVQHDDNHDGRFLSGFANVLAQAVNTARRTAALQIAFTQTRLAANRGR